MPYIEQSFSSGQILNASQLNQFNSNIQGSRDIRGQCRELTSDFVCNGSVLNINFSTLRFTDTSSVTYVDGSQYRVSQVPLHSTIVSITAQLKLSVSTTSGSHAFLSLFINAAGVPQVTSVPIDISSGSYGNVGDTLFRYVTIDAPFIFAGNAASNINIGLDLTTTVDSVDVISGKESFFNIIYKGPSY